MANDGDFGPLIRHLPSFFDTSELSDGIIECGERKFKIHRLVFCAQSGYFQKVFTGEWKESGGLLSLEDDDPSAVEAMIEFMYSFDYDSSGRAANSCSPMVFNVKVYSIAEKYDIPALKLKAKEKFETSVGTCWDMDDFPDAVIQIYHSTPDNDQGVREVVVGIACKEINQLLLKSRFCDVLDDTVGFASGIVRHLAEACQKQYRCPSCSKKWKAQLPSKTESYYCIHCGHRRSDWASYYT